jgi:hypothetical protein
MTIGSFLLILALLVIVALFIVRPFLEPGTGARADMRTHDELVAERERILEALLELDFDQQLGKVPEEIYAAQREHLVRRGAKVLKELDEIDAAVKSPAGEKDEIEALIAARKTGRTDARR